MVLTALRGALGFLTRLPVGHGEDAWLAFRASPWAFPLAGYAVGALLATPLLVLQTSVPGTTVAFAYVAWVVAVTGINHLDGVADVGDAAVVHGDPDDRRAVLKDTTVGVGAATAVAFVFVGLAAGAFGVVSLSLELAVAVVVAAEVGAKFGQAAVAALGTATHEGLGSQFTSRASGHDLLPAAVVALPAVALSWPSPAAGGSLAGAVGASLLALWWVRRLLGGVSGDAFGLVNEIGRVAGLHAGVIVWTLS